jgi:hypothetical protein
MVNGKPGDNLLADIMHHHQVYGDQEDELIRQIAKLSSVGELEDWGHKEIGWKPNPSTILEKARSRYEELLKRARERGWETDV